MKLESRLIGFAVLLLVALVSCDLMPSDTSRPDYDPIHGSSDPVGEVTEQPDFEKLNREMPHGVTNDRSLQVESCLNVNFPVKYDDDEGAIEYCQNHGQVELMVKKCFKLEPRYKFEWFKSLTDDIVVKCNYGDSQDLLEYTVEVFDEVFPGFKATYKDEIAQLHLDHHPSFAKGIVQRFNWIEQQWTARNQSAWGAPYMILPTLETTTAMFPNPKDRSHAWMELPIYYRACQGERKPSDAHRFVGYRADNEHYRLRLKHFLTIPQNSSASNCSRLSFAIFNVSIFDFFGEPFIQCWPLHQEILITYYEAFGHNSARNLQTGEYIDTEEDLFAPDPAANQARRQLERMSGHELDRFLDSKNEAPADYDGPDMMPNRGEDPVSGWASSIDLSTLHNLPPDVQKAVAEAQKREKAYLQRKKVRATAAPDDILPSQDTQDSLKNLAPDQAPDAPGIDTPSTRP